MPTSSFDTFFACTIMVAVALIGMAFLGSTMQTRIASTQDINKDSYLKAIADHIVSNPGSPADWGISSAVPSDFGFAAADSTGAYELDMDKISRLNSMNNYSLNYADLGHAAKLSNIALGISVSQLLTVNVLETSNFTVGADTTFTFTVSTSIDSKPATANLHCYVAADNYLTTLDGAVSEVGTSQISVQIPTSEADNALLIVFARASIDPRMTSYAIYNFANSKQESTPSSANLGLSPIDYTLNLDNSSDVTIQSGVVFSYSIQQPLPSFENSKTQIPKLIDTCPMVIVVSGHNDSGFFQEWAAYPQIPLHAGSNFAGSEQNIFSYIVTVNGVLCRLDLSLGDLPK